MKPLTILAAAVAAAPLLAAPASGGTFTADSRRVVTGLAYPVGAAAAPGDYNRLYVIEKAGRVRVFNLKTGTMNATPFLDINSIVGGGASLNDEQGLLGITFHPDFQNNGWFFVNYTNNSGNTVVARYTATSPDTADAGSALVIIAIAQPFANHNAGWLEFGPNDGYLYIATGDGGSFGDPGNRAQAITNQKLGKILRLDVSNSAVGDPYDIPADNPFVGVTGDDEIWAYGLRNPWRNAFDTNGDLYIADVGQDLWEEINFQPASSNGGENYGWRCREGMHNYNFSGNCSAQTFVEPFHEYSHSLGLSLTGGRVYRGCRFPAMDGAYFFADFVTNRIWSLDAGGTNAGLVDRTSQLTPSNGGTISRVASFAEDAYGTMYIIEQSSSSNSEMFQIVLEGETVRYEDVDCDGAVSFNDLLAVLAKYGPCVGCKEDVDGNDAVDFNDILKVLGAWD